MCIRDRVSPDSQLYQAHPEWVVKHHYERISVGRGQYVLDFANPAVVDGIFHAMKKIISETKLDYIKSVSYTHLRAHETDSYLVCRLLLEKKKTEITYAVFCLKKKNQTKKKKASYTHIN